MIILDSKKYYNLGSVSMTSDLNGTVSQYIEYIPFGEEMYSAHRNTYNTPYRYTAKELDKETGLYYYGARYYNPKLSLWLSVDPLLMFAPAKTPYHFVSNNPTNRIDPLGLTDYKVNGENRTINDGHNDLSMDVSNKEFNRLKKKFNRIGHIGYNRLLNKLSVKNGYSTCEIIGKRSKISRNSFILSDVIKSAHRPGGLSYGEWKYAKINKNSNYLFDQINRIATGFGIGNDTKTMTLDLISGGLSPSEVKYLKFFKGLGTVGGVITTVYSGNEARKQFRSGGWSEVGKHRDIYDAGVGDVGLVAIGLSTF